MKILQEANARQIAKEDGRCTTLEAENAFCSGECWDCDSCGGSATH